MSAVSIIASADHSGSGPSAAVDVTNFSKLLLDFVVGSVSASTPVVLDAWLETSSDGSTGWTKLHEFREANAASSQRVILATHDNYLRANWLARSMASGVSPACVWGITGTGKPDAT